MKRPHECQARQYGDQMICAACGLYWDTNDPEPPECHKVDRRTKKAREAAAGLDASIAHAKARRGLPDELPPPTLRPKWSRPTRRMPGGLAGMQAAYRLFLDRMEL